MGQCLITSLDAQVVSLLLALFVGMEVVALQPLRPAVQVTDASHRHIHSAHCHADTTIVSKNTSNQSLWALSTLLIVVLAVVVVVVVRNRRAKVHSCKT